MTLFLDASAIVAMLTREPDALELADELDRYSTLLWSPIVQWEVAAALMRFSEGSPISAREDVRSFGEQYRLKAVPIGEHESELAFDAFRRYGKRSGHPAQLNMGDCFAYACAKAHAARLLYKGNDFAQTDLA